jgi:cob(I)alamin adenosyltransferase
MTREYKVKFFERFGIPVLVEFGPGLALDGERHDVTVKLRESMQALVATLQARYPDAGASQWWQPRHLGGTAPTAEEAAELDAAVVARRAERRAAEAAKKERKNRG